MRAHTRHGVHVPTLDAHKPDDPPSIETNNAYLGIGHWGDGHPFTRGWDQGVRVTDLRVVHRAVRNNAGHHTRGHRSRRYRTREHRPP